MATEPARGLRRFVQKPLGRVLLLVFAFLVVLGTYAYASPVLAIPAFAIVGLALPIYAGLKRPRYLAVSGLVIIVLLAPVATLLFTQLLLVPVPNASSSPIVPDGAGGSVLQNAFVSPFNGGTQTNYSWTVTIHPEYVTSSIVFAEPPGNQSYAYALGAVPGYRPSPAAGNVTVDNSSLRVNVSYTAAPYTVTFAETGLPSGTLWSVSVEGSTANSTTPAVNFSLPSGSFSYLIATASGFAPSPASGTVTVTGSQSVPVSFQRVAYPVTFSESGLPSGVGWSVTLGVSTLATAGTSVVFYEPNGSYPYTVNGVTGFNAAPPAGVAVVAGTSPSVPIVFTQSSQTVTYTESGLPAGTSWNVVLGGTSLSSTGATIAFVEPNGTLSYTVGTVSGFDRSPGSGSVTLTGTSLGVSVKFTPTASYVFVTESGLPLGTNWSASVGGTSVTTQLTPVAVVLFVSTCPGATTNTSIYCAAGFPFQRVTQALPPSLTTVTNVTIRATIATEGIWSWQMALELRDGATTGVVFVFLVGDPQYNGIEGPIVGTFGSLYTWVLPEIYFEVLLFLALPFYVLLLLYMVLKNRERRRLEARQRAPGPIPPSGTTGPPPSGPDASGGPPGSTGGAPPSTAPAGPEEKVCPSCGAVVYPSEAKCWKCGGALVAQEGEPLPSSKP